MFLDHFMGFESSHNDHMGAALAQWVFHLEGVPGCLEMVVVAQQCFFNAVQVAELAASCVVMPIAGPIPYDRHPRLFGADLEDRWWLHGNTMHMHRAFNVWSREFSMSIGWVGALEGLASGGPLEAWGPQSFTQAL
ncbi:hypothetical protein EDC04DRAFT_2898248 [Pisolithus marmoratus]|nr:hypothetical protein EDC04DRAFT_2898248 [Pisolithus marmoratus]